MSILKIISIYDGHKEIWLDDALMVAMNHDDDGWVGMARLETALRHMAAHLRIPVIDEMPDSHLMIDDEPY